MKLQRLPGCLWHWNVIEEPSRRASSRVTLPLQKLLLLTDPPAAKHMYFPGDPRGAG